MAGWQSCDAAILGGGPAGAAAGRLLATWGHSVCILHKTPDRSRGLAESAPPSTRKLLAVIGVLDAVERAGFVRSRGNTAWWGSGEARIEQFARGEAGFQVFRPELDDLLLDQAAAAGADVHRAASVRTVELGEDSVAITGTDGPSPFHLRCRIVLDCSGRAGVVAKRYRRIEPSYRMYAMVGTWCRRGGWGLRDETHTVVETYEDGWIWSVPVSATVRQVGAMVDGSSPRVGHGRALREAYRAEILKTRHVSALVERATLRRMWACDAGLYSSDRYAGPQFLLVGDAGSFIDPLSSFGIKKALGSAWLASIVANTCLIDSTRRSVAGDFFCRWERDVYATHLRRSAEFARTAYAEHPHPFWARRIGGTAAAADRFDEGELLRSTAIQAALEALRRSPQIGFRLCPDLRLVKEPVVRGREIVLDDAIALNWRTGTARPNGFDSPIDARTPSAGPEAHTRSSTVRFLNNVDLLALARLSCCHRQVSDVFDAYCRAEGSVPLPNVLGGLSFLVASGILTPRV